MHYIYYHFCIYTIKKTITNFYEYVARHKRCLLLYQLFVETSGGDVILIVRVHQLLSLVTCKFLLSRLVYSVSRKSRQSGTWSTRFAWRYGMDWTWRQSRQSWSPRATGWTGESRVSGLRWYESLFTLLFVSNILLHCV